jgi:alpha-tubulin suppressor-like RCC1 family protein
MVGQQIQLTATTTEAGNILTTPVAWTSSNTAVVTVTSSGLVMALTLGQVTITAMSEGQSGMAALTTTTGLMFAMISAGSNHTCGVTLDGIAYCWGDNSSGQLGNGAKTNSPTPIPVSGALSFAMVSAGGHHTCGVTGLPTNPPPVAGAVYCWGDNSFGQLGNGTTINSPTPVAVSGGGMFTTVSAGSQHTCDTLVNTGLQYCWGDNTFGQLGNGTTTSTTTPVAIVNSPPLRRVSAGTSHTCGVYAPGGNPNIPEVLCWGDNSAGQFGNGTTISSNIPIGLFSAFFISAGTLYSCATNIGSGWCSGNNTYGQLGNGTTKSSSNLVAVQLPQGSSGADFSLDISAGARHACGAVSTIEGQPAYCWGDNSAGQLGNGTTTNSATPVVVVGGLNFLTVSAGGSHTCGIALQFPINPPTSGAVYCWGDNSSGQLGNSWTMSSSVPVNVAGSP